MTKEVKNIQCRKDNLFNKCWENWTATCKRMELEHSLTPYTKINSKWMKDLKVGWNIIKLLEANPSKILFYINYSNILVNIPPRKIKRKMKRNNLDLIILTNFCTDKEIINKL